MKIKIAILLALVSFISGCKANTGVDVHHYDTMMSCSKKQTEEVDGTSINSLSNIYYDYNADGYVTKAIYQSVGDVQNYNDVILASLDNLIELYNEVDGIVASRYISREKVVFEFIYDYENIDQAKFNLKLGDIIDDDFILKRADMLPFSVEEFVSSELSGYDCKKR